MVLLLRRILTARALAAGISLISSAIAVHLLPSEQYGLYAVLASYAAIASPVFFQPFSKYVLVSGDWMGVERAFYAFQPLVLSAVGLMAAACWVYFRANGILVSAVVVFAISQGWKEFAGELARVRGAITEMQRLYVLDSMTTLGLTVLVLVFHPSAAMVLLAGGASSLAWSFRYLPKRQESPPSAIIVSVADVYRYSYGVVGTSAINSATISLARQGLLRSAPPHLVDGTQFLLDLLQKPMALIGSSAITAALPEVRKSGVRGVIPTIVKVITLTLIALALGALIVVSVPQSISAKVGSLSYAFALSAAVFIWSNRYKSVAMDLPLMSSGTHSRQMLLGALGAIACMGALQLLGVNASLFLSLAAAAMFSGGVVSVLASRSEELISDKEVRLTLLPPLVVVLVSVPMAMIWGGQ